MEALGINLGSLVVFVIAFIVVFTVLSNWVYNPVLEMMETRKKTIAQGLEDAREAAEARANAEKAAEKVLAEAQTRAATLVREANERAEAVARDVKAAADADAGKARTKALAEVEEERNRILGDLRGQVAAISIAATQKLLGEALDEKRQHALLAEFFSGVKSGKIVALEGVSASGQSAEVTSALPLTKEEQDTIKKDVLAKAGASEVSFRVDPIILGGLVVKVGDKVMDGSVAGKLDGLRSSLH